LTQARLRAALVTGGAARIGAAIARDLARNNFAVAIHTHNSLAEAKSLIEELGAEGARLAVVQGDLTDSAQRGQLIERAVEAIGPLDLLVNNASQFEHDSILDFDEALFDLHMTMHVKAPSLLARDFARQLPQGVAGVIVNIIDQRVWRLTPRFYSYTLSKAALWTATQTLAQALAPRIRVNAIGPGPTLKGSRQSEEDFAAQVEGLMLKAGPSLEEFGRTVRFLFDTPSITGQMIALDGGQHLAWQTPDVAEIPE
jgi:NAD(P)-dependent dehydrogenase (short-subunit alcohol dehydrogenase family)